MATPYHLPKKRGVLKGTRISFLRDAFVEVSHSSLRIISLEYPEKTNPNIPSKTKSFQRLQNEEEIELKIRAEK